MIVYKTLNFDIFIPFLLCGLSGVHAAVTILKCRLPMFSADENTEQHYAILRLMQT